jgi:hypothetical protein
VGYYLSFRQGGPNDPGRIHPNFTLDFLHFQQNRPWNVSAYKEHPQIKVVFYFDDSSLLNDCPFVAKVTLDQKLGYRFFGVAYGVKSDSEALRQWSSKFPWWSLVSY